MGIAGIFAKNEIWWPSGTTHTHTQTQKKQHMTAMEKLKKKKIANLV